MTADSALILPVGVVGWGGRGGGIAREGYRALGGLLQPVACVEPNDDRYEQGCRDFPSRPRRHPSVTALLDAEPLGGVIIGSPNEFHLEHLRAFAGRRVPVLLEKPLDATFERICDVVRFAAAYPAPILVGHCMRFAPILRAAKTMLARGDIGQVCSVRFVQNCHYGNGIFHGWRRERACSGGQLIEKATHDFDIMLWFLETWPQTVAALAGRHAFGGDKPADLRCRDCADRATCPESIQNINHRNGNFPVEEIARADDLCVFSRGVDAADNEHTLTQFANGAFGTYVQWFFSPRSYHHRVYELHGTLGAMEIDLGAEHGGTITVCPRFGTLSDRLTYRFDYLGRNHYNGDGEMMKHFYQVCRGETPPAATVPQAFAAELLGYAANEAAAGRRLVNIAELVPADLRHWLTTPVH